MTTEKKAPTAEDVARRYQTVREACRWEPDALDWLRDMALLGVQVAELKGAGITRAESFAKYHDEHAGYGGASFELHARATTHIRSQAARAELLEARVAELTRERDLLKYERDSEESRGDEEQRRGDALESERDALRAQVAPMREALEWIERETHPEDGLTFERIHAKAAGALSAPPAETKGVKS